ncbi:hypothetical protein PMAYCL1PPCAC_20151, partial [Pristionchus mayeri]
QVHGQMRKNVTKTESPRLELLPRDLIWTILDYLPQALFDLRLTSSKLRSHVDNYAYHSRQSSIVERLGIFSRTDVINFWID